MTTGRRPPAGRHPSRSPQPGSRDGKAASLWIVICAAVVLLGAGTATAVLLIGHGHGRGGTTSPTGTTGTTSPTGTTSDTTTTIGVSTVVQDLADLKNDQPALGSDLLSIQGDLKNAASDLATAQSAALGVEREAKKHPGGNGGQVCGAAGSVSGDAAMVSGDAVSVSGDASNLQNDISTLQHVIVRLGSDYHRVRSLAAPVASALPAGLPAPSTVSQALSVAEDAISLAGARANAVIEDANNDVTAAYDAANAANKAGGCGRPSSPPPPISTI